ncbi:MAG: hypothetical protein CVU05_02395 [Bacteroidetes bacterium HGW-Bacteroidetes-21]|jgi:hypothetical protein|nr:MAG: hypothetical protein CVU05_02395 [Bacteroidetes bacterium HGW-Bacteroidetes-21]
MKKSGLWLILLSFLSFSSVFAQKGDAEVRINMRDGSIYNGTVKVMNIELTSDYGKLSIPFADISQIELGIIPEKKNKTKIDFQLKQLLNEEETTRQNAYEELMKMEIGEIYLVEDFISSESYTMVEGIYTADELLSEIMLKYGVKELVPYDMISFGTSFSMGGISSFQNVTLKTEFGMLTIPRNKIETFEVVYVPGENQNNQKNIILQASKHISGNVNGGWLNTGIIVKKGQKIQITARGSITLASLSNAKYTPDGPEGTAKAAYTYEGAYPQYGMVVYKVGEQGSMISAGSKYSGSVKDSGVLYISIYETVYNAANTGTYNVTIKAF